MNESNLEEVLEEYASAAPEDNDLKILRSFTDKYPQYADELADFAAARSVIRHAPEEELSAEEERSFGEAGIKNLRRVLSSLDSSAAQNTLQSLVDAAKTKGLNRSKFAAALGLSTSLVMYLEKRRLEFSSIPKAVVAKIARVLETGEEIVSAYLNQSPDFAANTSFKTETRAENLPPKSFQEAVREDQTLSAAEKRSLLELN